MKITTAIFVVFCVMSPQADDLSDLSINKIQVIGSHNSFKQAIDPVLFQLIKNRDSLAAKKIDYSHITLAEQLSIGLLNLELDVYVDSKGGKYATPQGLQWGSKQNTFDSNGLMKEPGFKVFHILDIDFRSSCLTFKNCLLELKNWSDTHKNHFPVFITLNARDEPNHASTSIPEKFTPEVFDQLDNVILETLGNRKVLKPDDVRGNAQTLEAAIREGHWPKVSEAKGKFVFILDETGQKLASYVQGHPSLKGRMLFVNAEPGNDEAAFLIINDPLKDSIKIKDMVSKGYIVRTRADADTQEARNNDTKKFDAACRSGAQIITTDYYLKSTHFKSDYVVRFKDAKYVRKNPILN